MFRRYYRNFVSGMFVTRSRAEEAKKVEDVLMRGWCLGVRLA
jgi:hypothetical protein